MTGLQARGRSLQQHANTGGHYIDSLIWWSLNGNRVSHNHLKALAQQNHLPEHFLPLDIKPSVAPVKWQNQELMPTSFFL